ncbi:BamA/OMP85 family outer membrane protein [Haloferula sp.]|uniref:BamA/OMP85 family outer membrane protein n=1 Tax=Haloferula sp. TaxID=2497595 RepID=UPI003C7782E7
MRASLTVSAMIATLLPIFGETEIQIIGMQSLSESDIERLIGGRFDYIRSQPASRARTADSAFMVEQLFRKNGYNDAEVSWKILSSNLIRLRIDEGPRETLGTVTIEGLEDPEQANKLESLFRLNPSKRNISTSTEPPLRQSDFEDGLGLMESELNSNGYWKPTLEITEQQKNPETGHTDVVIKVNPGTLFTISNPRFSNEQSAGLDERVAPYVGRPANTTNINELRLRVTEYYRSQGFVNATVRMEVEIGSEEVFPRFNIVEGKRFRLGEVTFNGLEKTKPERIRGRIEPLRNAYLDGNKVDTRIRQLIATGAFSSLRIETKEREGDIMDATLQFEEADARGISLTGGFGTYEGAIIGASYYDRNFGGMLRNFSAGGEISQRSLLGEISLTDPWLWGTDIRGNARLFSLSRNNEGYDNWTSGIEGSLGYSFTENSTSTMILGLSTARTTSDGLPVNQLGETDYQHAYLGVTHRIDFRDSPILPTEGWHFEIPLFTGSAVGDDSTTYVRSGFESSYYQPLGDAGQLAFGARANFIVPSGNQLPIDLRLFNGGPRSVRSYAERELGPKDRGYPIGGEASWVTNIEYIRSVTGPLKGVVFIDAGGLSSDWEDFGMNKINVALGLGIRLDLPIGPVRLEYGHNMTQDPGEPSGAWHFAIGNAF